MKQQITKNAIQNSFLKLLGEKPFNKITVRDIVEDCGLTRNTFYYYYEDIYDIVDEIIRQGIEGAIDSADDNQSVIEIFSMVVHSFEENRKLVHNLLRTKNTDEIEPYFFRAGEVLIQHSLDNIAGENELSADDRRLICDCCNSVLHGLIIRWLNDDMRYPIYDDLQRIGILFSDTIEVAVQRAKNTNK